MARGKYKVLPDLFATGSELVLPDNSVMWVQVMNPFELDEARKDATATRNRLRMAIKEIGTNEYEAMRGAFASRDRDSLINEMLMAKQVKFFTDAQTSVLDDPEWKERLEVARRFDEVPPSEEAEQELLDKINRDFMVDVNKRVEDERAFQERTWRGMTEDELFEEYDELWVDAKTNDVALKAFQVCEIYYGARCCEAVPTAEGEFNERSHAECDHREKVFESKDEVRESPGRLLMAIRGKLEELAMSERDARFSDRQESSSASSPLPSEAEASTPSTPDATPSAAPGT